MSEACGARVTGDRIDLVHSIQTGELETSLALRNRSLALQAAQTDSTRTSSCSNNAGSPPHSFLDRDAYSAGSDQPSKCELAPSEQQRVHQPPRPISTSSPHKKRTGSDLSPSSSLSQDAGRKRANDRATVLNHHNSVHQLETDGGSSGGSGTPLFFSDSRQLRPQLPPRLSSSEAAAKMMSRASKEESRGPKTIQIARGSMIQDCPKRPAAVRTLSGGGRSHSGHTATTKSPDSANPQILGLSMLDCVAITEVLDLDERPTFVLDLADHANFEPGPLRVMYANPALQTMSSTFDRIRGSNAHDHSAITTISAFTAFKSWTISYVKEYEAMDVVLPSYKFAGLVWSAIALRKRLRLFKGAPKSSSIGRGSANSPAGLASSSARSRDAEPSVGVMHEEAQDYFGSDAVMGYTPEHSRTQHKASALQTPSHTEGHRSPMIQMSSSESSRTSRSVSPIPLYDPHVSHSPVTSNHSEQGIVARLMNGYFDWTRLPDSASLPAHIRFARSIDWASTPLGPMQTWSVELRSMCNLIMASPHPAAMYWGEHYIAIYNEAYVLLAGSKHPTLMGQSYKDAWVEIWDGVKEVFDCATRLGESTMKDDDQLFISRSAGENLEETYFSWSIIPLVGSDGSVVGLYNPAFEKTRRKVAERRMFTLRELGEKTATARDLKMFWAELIKAFQYNDVDAPFVLVYSVYDDHESDSQSSAMSSAAGPKSCILEGSHGIPLGHPAAAAQFDLRNGTEYFAEVFRNAMKEDRPVYLSVKGGTLDPQLLENIEWGGFGDPCNAAVCFPVCLPGGEATLGFFVMGINPRRPYDDDYSLFVQLVNRQLTTAMASVVLFEEEIRRGERAARIAAQKQSQLSERLKLTTQQAEESELRFTRMAELAPVGMFIADSAGQITYCNDKWYEIANTPRDKVKNLNWMEAVHVDDRARLADLWAELVQNSVAFSTELRFDKLDMQHQKSQEETWVLASASPDRNAQGELRTIFGSITDISQQKWAEHLEKRSKQEAVEMKRQQENFIDITSHEMRNPLSAILQCADEIKTSLIKASTMAESQDAVVQNAIDASLTIELCAQHQKRIVDDILTMSKMDSALLLVTPCPTDPRSIVQRALKMFENELTTNDIHMDFHADKSLDDLGITWVTMDPSRVLQVLINLTTNSIKFTARQDKRKIIITLGASLGRLPSNNSVQFFKSRSRKDLTQKTEEWGTGEEVYIHFAVQDTGRGLTEDEKQILFQRFTQASPRTHVTYGGSGLGLFISRELVELQGGEIGVDSTAGQGSTFAFYIKARRTGPPGDDMEGLVTGPTATDKTSSHGTKTENDGHDSSQNRSADGHLKKPAKATVKHGPRPQGPLKILIVEDNLVNQKVLARQLRNFGAIVFVANHGEECLEILKMSTYWHDASINSGERHEIDVVLMDQEMPVMDGLTCTKEIRQLEAAGTIIAHIPIIAVTANARSEQIATAISIGMDNVVSKPFTIHDLIPKVEQLVGKYPSPKKAMPEQTPMSE